LNNFRSELSRVVNRFSPGDGNHPSPLPGVRCIKMSHTNARTKNYWSASLCIVTQGVKEILLGREVYRCEAGHTIAAPVDLPVTSRICSASPDKPFLCLKVEFDPMALSEVAKKFEKAPRGEVPLRALFIGKASDPMLEAALRLGKLFQAPGDAAVLGPLVTKEIFFHLLKGADGPAILQFVRSGNTMHQISQAIYSLRASLNEEIDIPSLAKESKMSRSAFFKHFKEATALSPIQYQKRLRLLEARRLMVEEGETAEGSAYKVGYNSASQFSREYSRAFGNSPLRDARKIKNPEGSIHQRDRAPSLA
jgi:AraC-like DNA-binding protein